MTITRKHGFLAAVTVASLAFAGCDLDVGDLNNPGIDELEENPTAVTVNAACTGLVIGNRGNYSAANGYVTQLGILGREAYNFDAADPRYVGELLTTSLNPGSPFGGNFWTGPYANIRLSNIIIVAVDKVPDFSAEEISGIKGFAKTMQALDLLTVTVTRDTNGVVIDTAQDRGELGALVDPAEAYDFIAGLLDEGAADLDAGGDHFTFPLSSGYNGFDDPAGFRSFNRAILARVRIYQEDYAGALTALGESFLFDDPAMLTLEDLDLGVYQAYSTSAGDTTNGLINPNIFAHPSFITDAEASDARVARKLVEVENGGGSPTTGLGSTIRFTMYSRPDSPTPIIRNEELILIKAEALWFSGMKTEAIAELNLIRTVSAGLGPSAATPTSTDAEFITALLYERRYSLMFEGGHRWIDLRRFGLELPVDTITDGEETRETVRNVRYPIPKAECDARGGPEVEPRCALSSQ
jgi:starch-binding outer membrane protein, SusD/RagB family